MIGMMSVHHSVNPYAYFLFNRGKVGCIAPGWQIMYALHHLPVRIYGVFGGKKIGSNELRTQLRTHKKAR
jgi:hypothetical protein